MQKYVERIGKSLAGKPNFSIPDVAIRPVSRIVRDLTNIPQANWWRYAFSREPMNGRFCDEERQAMYQQAVACGERYAQACQKQYGTIPMEELAEKLGLDLVFQDRPQSSSRIVFADFQEPGTIHVYEDGLEKGEALLAQPDVKNAFGCDVDIASVLIAHELFHVLELRDPAIWTRTHSVVLWKAGWFTNRSPVAVLSEIAAMAFAKWMTGLPFSPYVLDAFLVYGYSESASSALYEEMSQAAQPPASGFKPQA